MATLRELVAERENDYRALEHRYKVATGGELVADPFGSFAHGPPSCTRSASVVIGTFDSAPSLVSALVALEHSSFNVRHPDLLEVVVVDDGSTDATRERLLSLELDLRLRYVRQDRGGLTCAHNTGLGFADGDVVVFCDSDVVLMPYALEELMKRHEVLDGVTLLGFRFDVAPDDPRLDPERLPAEIASVTPAFWRDFRVAFPGWPANICRDTRHLEALGCGRRVWMTNGCGYDLAGMVVGALFSIARADLLAMGGSDERLVGWGCEDSLIGARSLALGNAIVPVYSAAGWHVWHPRRDPAELGQFGTNLRTLERIYDEEFGPRDLDLARVRARAKETVDVGPRGPRAAGEPPSSYPPCSPLERGDCAYAVGRFDEALAHYTEAGSSAGCAACLVELGNAEAAAAVEEAAPLTIARALAALGEHRLARERLAACRDSFDASWILATPSEQHKRRGNEHARQGLHRIASVDFDLALVVDPDAAWAHFDRSLSLRALERQDEALASVRRADALLHPEDANRTWIHSTLAELLGESGSPDEARAHVRRALDLYPDNEDALALARSLAERRHRPWVELSPERQAPTS